MNSTYMEFDIKEEEEIGAENALFRPQWYLDFQLQLVELSVAIPVALRAL